MRSLGLVPVNLAIDTVRESSSKLLNSAIASFVLFALCFSLSLGLGWQWTMITFFLIQIVFTVAASISYAKIYVAIFPHLEAWKAIFGVLKNGVGSTLANGEQILRDTAGRGAPFFRHILLYQWFMLAGSLALSAVDMHEAPISALILLAGLALLAMAIASGKMWRFTLRTGNNVAIVVLLTMMWLVLLLAAWGTGWIIVWNMADKLLLFAMIFLPVFWIFQMAGLLITVSCVPILIGVAGLASPEHMGVQWDRAFNANQVDRTQLPAYYRTPKWKRIGKNEFALQISPPDQRDGRVVIDTAMVDIGETIRFADERNAYDKKKNEYRHALGIVDPETGIVNPLQEEFYILANAILEPGVPDKFGESRPNQVSHIALGRYADKYEGYDPDYLERMKRFSDYDPFAPLAFQIPSMQLQHPLGAGEHPVTSPYGAYRTYNGGTHKGVDWRAAVGSTVYAAHDGIAIDVVGPVMYRESYVTLESSADKTLKTRYVHLSRVLVKAGQSVSAGEPIGLSGGKPNTPGTRHSTGPHLHFEVLENNVEVEPLAWVEGDRAKPIAIQGKDFMAFPLAVIGEGPEGGVLVELPTKQLLSVFPHQVLPGDLVEITEISPKRSALILSEDSKSPVFTTPVSSEGIMYPPRYKDTFFFPLESARYGATLVGVDGLETQLGRGAVIDVKTDGQLVFCCANEEIAFKSARTLVGDPARNNDGPPYVYEIKIVRSGSLVDLTSLIQ